MLFHFVLCRLLAGLHCFLQQRRAASLWYGFYWREGQTLLIRTRSGFTQGMGEILCVLTECVFTTAYQEGVTAFDVAETLGHIDAMIYLEKHTPAATEAVSEEAQPTAPTTEAHQPPMAEALAESSRTSNIVHAPEREVSHNGYDVINMFVNP